MQSKCYAKKVLLFGTLWNFNIFNPWLVTYSCESWKKAGHQRIDAFDLWCWRRLLKVPWTARSSNQSILREINPEYSLEGLMLKLKLQYLHHLMSTENSLENPWCWERLRAEEEGVRGWDGLTASPMQWTRTWANSGTWWGAGWPGVLQSMGSQRIGHNWTLSNNNNV